ncbi:MAG: TPM domain-containing protein [Archangium sp.]
MLLALVLAAAIPSINQPVTDLAHVLSPEAIERLSAKLRAHREATQVQLAVLTIDSTDGEPIESYSLRAAVAWGGGSARANNGGLFVLAVKDRKMRIELGYGLEGDVPDASAAQILSRARNSLRSSDFDGAVTGVMDELILGTGGSLTAPSEPEPEPLAPTITNDATAKPLRPFGDGVTDDANVLSSKARDQINGEIRRLAADVGIRFALVTVRDLSDRSSFELWANDGMKQWSCAQTQPKYCGLIVLVSGDRSAHVKLGAALARRMPSEAIETAIATIQPKLDAKDFDGAATQLVHESVTRTTPPPKPQPPKIVSAKWSIDTNILVWVGLVVLFTILSTVLRERLPIGLSAIGLLTLGVSIELTLRLTEVSDSLSLGAFAASIAGLRFFGKSVRLSVIFVMTSAAILVALVFQDPSLSVALMGGQLAVAVLLALIPDEKPATFDADGLVPPTVITYDGAAIEKMKREADLAPPRLSTSSSSDDSWGSDDSSSGSGFSSDSSSDFGSSSSSDYSGGGGDFGGGGASSSW